jgi:hypothetical protein
MEWTQCDHSRRAGSASQPVFRNSQSGKGRGEGGFAALHHWQHRSGANDRKIVALKAAESARTMRKSSVVQDLLQMPCDNCMAIMLQRT